MTDASGDYDSDLPLVIQQSPEDGEARPYDGGERKKYHLSRLQDRGGLVSKIAQRIRREKEALEGEGGGADTAESITLDSLNGSSSLRRIINWKIINHGRQTIIIV